MAIPADGAEQSCGDAEHVLLYLHCGMMKVGITCASLTADDVGLK